MTFADLKTKELQLACKEYQVKELYAFGSLVSGDFSKDSDLDFLVVFDRSGYDGAFDQFMGLKERLENIYNRPVDLILQNHFRNPLFAEEVNKSKKLLYAA